MKIIKKTFLHILLLFTVLAYSQNEEVDKRNGFKSIKLGSHYLSFKGIKDISSSNPNNIVGLWGTSDKELGYFFNNKIDFFELTFDKKTKELITIQVVVVINKPYTDPSVYKKYFSIADKLVLALGTASSSNQKEMSILWLGSKLGMGLTLKSESLDFDDNGKIKGIASIKFSVVSLNKKEEQIKKGF